MEKRGKEANYESVKKIIKRPLNLKIKKGMNLFYTF